MAWSEAQKEQGRRELERRRQQTPATRRNAFLKPACLALGSLVLAIIFYRVLGTTHEWFHRFEVLTLVSLCLFTLLIATIVAYIRFLDWRRGVSAAT